MALCKMDSCQITPLVQYRRNKNNKKQQHTHHKTEMKNKNTYKQTHMLLK